MSNFDKLRETRLRQSLNIKLIFVTFNVVALDILMDVRFQQPENITPIFVTFDVSSFDTSSEVM